MSTISSYSPHIRSLLNPIQNTTSSSSQNMSSKNTTLGNTSSSNSNTSLVSSLLSGGGYSPEVLSVLQGPDSAGNFDPMSELLGGGTSNSNSYAALWNNLYTTSADAAVTAAKDNVRTSGIGSSSSGNGGSSSSKPEVSGSSIIDGLINTDIQNSVAQDNTLIQNAKTTLANNS